MQAAGKYLMFVRHGETVGNIEQIAHGQSESPLNDRGIRQAEHTAQFLRGWPRQYHHIYSSPLSRAVHTAQAIADVLELPVSEHSDLIEANLGLLEGVTYKELSDFGYARRSIKDDDFDGHKGESPRVLANRMLKAIRQIRSRHPGENIILVSHGGAISHALSILLDSKPLFGPRYIMKNSAVSEVLMHPVPELLHLNHFDHIPEELRADPNRADQKIND